MLLRHDSIHDSRLARSERINLAWRDVNVTAEEFPSHFSYWMARIFNKRSRKQGVPSWKRQSTMVDFGTHQQTPQKQRTGTSPHATQHVRVDEHRAQQQPRKENVSNPKLDTAYQQQVVDSKPVEQQQKYYGQDRAMTSPAKGSAQRPPTSSGAVKKTASSAPRKPTSGAPKKPAPGSAKKPGGSKPKPGGASKSAAKKPGQARPKNATRHNKKRQSVAILKQQLANASNNAANVKKKTLLRKDAKKDAKKNSKKASRSAADVAKGVFKPGEVKEKLILQDITGTAFAGEVVALMGDSGAGKTTLMNVLMQRNIRNLNVQAKIYVNGRLQSNNPNHGILKSISAYVQQKDMFLAGLSVKETLLFQAMLRMPSFLKRAHRTARVDTVIREMNLTNCQNTVIGLPGTKTISGGEARRLSFASEILTNPAVLICDEPTTGLDSYMAENVVQTLQNMAGKGKTIICTIRQPSSVVFNMFDKVVLLAEGKTAFVGSRSDCRRFFETSGFPCPMTTSLCDHYINILAIKSENETECRDRAQSICRKYLRSEYNKKLNNAIDREISEVHNQEAEDDDAIMSSFAMRLDSKNRTYKASAFTQFIWLVWRAWLCNVRDKRVVQMRLGQAGLIALFVGLLFYQQGKGGHTKTSQVQNINGALFFSVNLGTFMNAFAVINSFPQEMAVFLRENQNMVYRTSIYLTAKWVAELPIFTLFGVMCPPIVYWLVALRFDGDFTYFFVYMMIFCLLTHTVISVGYFLACATGDVQLALAIYSPIQMPLLLFGGFYLNQGSIPSYIRWVQWFSWYRYVYEIFYLNQWHGNKVKCKWGPEEAALAKNNTPCIIDGNELIKESHYEFADVKYNVFALFAMLIIARLLAVACVIIRVRLT